jgi:predicted nucleic acid-binding protein
MGIVLLDTSIIIALFDGKDLLHNKAVPVVREVQGSNEMIFSIVSYAELLVGAYQHSQEAVAKLDRFLNGLFRMAPMTPAIAHTGAELRASRSSLKLPDALIIATGIHHRADQIITGDEGWHEVDPTVRVI